MMVELSKKMKHFQVGVFNELANLKTKHIKEGKELIDLSIGSPDLPPADFIKQELIEKSQDASNYQYALKGIDQLNEAICKYYSKKYNVELQNDTEVSVVMGSQDGLVHLPMVLTNPGDIILVPDPGYTAYAAGIALADAIPYKMLLNKERNYLPSLADIPEEVAQKAKLMILNYPGNPVPAVGSYEFFQEVVEFARRYNIVVIHDFAYSELYYTKDKPISFLSVPGAKEIGVEFNSLSKSFNMAGCRIGYVIGNQTVISALKALKSNLDYGVFLPIQYAAVRALDDESDFSEELRNIYKNRRDILVNGLNELGWDIQRPKASMFLWAKVPDGYTSTSFTYELVERAGVVVTPGNAFGENGEDFVRIALVQPEAILELAVEKIRNSGLF
ncbi:LL-diaminopimelate aminotransferase [Litchfieldia alkalitelluris]|uniref:LL-diaminopimelate aminotransferase n=1 Tax=Litchfieldia alkalitelluris TaxID=304268 RepID=UPI001115B153|nr:LL-diaminopimelate aminotransferase [Litchfieldia alkalitelluris]